MKKFTLLFVVMCLVLSGLAQAPHKMSYQAIVRDAQGELVRNAQVGMQISLLQGTPDGTEVYHEIIYPVTNTNGLITVHIGGENGFDAIDWANGPYFIQTQIDPEGGSNFTITAVSQLLSVPFAFHAMTTDQPGPQGPEGPVGPAGADGQMGPAGDDGLSAYEIWLELGNEGAEADFITSLTGPAGTDGTHGVDGLNGADGQSAYEIWLSLGNEGTEDDFIASLTGPAGTDGTHGVDGLNGADGLSAYEIWIDLGNEGTEADFIASLTGPAGTDGTHGVDGLNGADGLSAYEIWLSLGNEGTEEDFIAYFTAETDPLFTAWDKSEGITITESQISDLQAYLTDYTVTVEDVTEHQGALVITESQISDLQEYLTEETDPVFTSTFDFEDVQDGDLLMYDSNTEKWIRFTPDYLTDYEETDPLFTAWDKSEGIVISESQISDLQAYLTDYTVTVADVTGHQGALVITESQIIDLQEYLTEETDPVFTSTFDFEDVQDGDLLMYDSDTEKWIRFTPDYLTDYEETDPLFTAWDKSEGITITESQITNLQGYLTEEMDPAFTTHFDFTDAEIGDLLQFDGEKWVKYTPDYAAGTHTHEIVTEEVDGFMSAADKTKLNSLENVIITAGTGISVTGTYPNIEISNTLIGQTYTVGLNEDLGGYVFYVTPDGKHGLVAATQNQSESCNWYNAQNVISDPANHTDAGKKFTDWRLPTRHELNLMYSQRTSIGGFDEVSFWSSTEVGSVNAWSQTFFNGMASNLNKSNSLRVRAVRAF